MPENRLRPSIGSDDFDPREVAGEAVPVLRPGQRPVDAGGADLQRPGARDRVLDVDHGAEVRG